MTDAERWAAVLENDSRWDGVFFYAVASTGVFCRPSCPSRPPRRENVRFFRTSKEALQAGFRPCKRCRPDLSDDCPEAEAAAGALAALEAHYADREALEAALDGLGLSRRRLGEAFRAAWGVTLGQRLEALRLDAAQRLLADTAEPVVQVAYTVGYGSLSAFYRAFRRRAGRSPAQYRADHRKEALQ